MTDWLENVADKSILQDNLTFASLYIAIYEHMTDYVVSNIKEFLCDFEIKNGEVIYTETDDYKTEIKNRIVDKKGNKDVTKASFLWLIDNDAIDNADYESFLAAKKIRNKYAHNLSSVIYEGVTEEEIKCFFDMFALYKKIGRWYFINIEAELLGEKLPENTELMQVETAANVMFGMILEVLYNGKSEEYKALIESAKKEI